MSATTFGRALRDARVRAGVSQRALASALHVSQAYLRAVERGERPPLGWVRIVEAARVLGVDARALTDAALPGAGPTGGRGGKP